MTDNIQMTEQWAEEIMRYHGERNSFYRRNPGMDYETAGAKAHADTKAAFGADVVSAA